MTPSNGHRHDREGILLVGHGTRDPGGIAEFHAAAELIQRSSDGRPVAPCFLELATPSIAEGIEQLAVHGATRIIVVPLLLFSAGHAKRDIPAAVSAAAAGRPELTIQQTAPLECEPQILSLSARRFREAIATFPPVPADQTLLLLVGRGSSDAEATAAMHRFAQLRAVQTATGRTIVCFLAMQKPFFAEALANAAASDFQRFVVQPHLLFSGELLEHVRRAIEGRVAAENGSGVFFNPPATARGTPRDLRSTEKDSRSPGADMPPRQWILTAPLGPEPELAAAVVNVVEQNRHARQEVT
jgi:sirohydrochlorin cobaltochelatase